MSDVKIYHYPHCGSSVNALKVAEELGIEPEIVLYQKTPPGRDELTWLVEHLEDPPTMLVRRDSQFAKLGLSEEDVATPAQIVDLLVQRKMLLQRPIVVRGDRAIIGRPKDRIRAFLTEGEAAGS